MKIVEIEYPSYYDNLDKDNGNMDIFVKLNDGMTYTLVVTTPSHYYWYMDKEGLDYIPASPPDLIVRNLSKEVVEKALQTYIKDNAYWLKLYFLAGENHGLFDEKQMNTMIQKIKEAKEEIFGLD